MSIRRPLAVLVLLLLAGTAPAQITWTFDYRDPAGSGFNDPGVDAGEVLSRGQLRRNTLTAATAYLNTLLDARGNVTLTVGVSGNSPGLASFGPGQYVGFPENPPGTPAPGSFQNGGVYQAARTNQLPFDGSAGFGEFNFGSAFTYAGQQNPPSGFDLTTIAIHELTHALGFLSVTRADASGLAPAGFGPLFGVYDRYLQRGTGPLAAAGLFNTNLSSPSYATFTGPLSTLTNGNDPATGLFFGGPYAREVYGGPVPLFAPGGYQQGSSASHVSDPAAVMFPSINGGEVKRFQPYERAMLLDLGWNVFNWNGTSGNWADGASAVANSRWRTDQGIVFDGVNGYNLNPAPAPAPILPPVGTTTADLVYNFGGNGSAGYVAANNLGAVRAARVVVNNTGSGLADIGGGQGSLLFGQNSDGTNTLLAPQIQQLGPGPASVTSAVQIPAGRVLAVVGSGSGDLTLGGGVSGGGTLQRDGAGGFVLVVSAPTSHTGPTEVVRGTLRLTGTGNLAASSPVTVGMATGTTATLDAGTLAALTLSNGQVLRGAGAVTATVVQVGGGTVQGGTVNAASGTLSLSGSLTVSAASTVRAVIGTGNTSTRVAAAGPFAATLPTDVFTVALQLDGLTLAPFTPTTGAWTVLSYGGTTLPPGSYTGSGGGAPFTVTLTDGAPLADWTATLNSTSLAINSFTPVPEPATLLVVAAGGLALARRRRR